jgi:hypothetical protein
VRPASEWAKDPALSCWGLTPEDVIRVIQADARADAEAELDQARHDAAHHRERLARMEAKLAEVEGRLREAINQIMAYIDRRSVPDEVYAGAMVIARQAFAIDDAQPDHAGEAP